MARRLPPLNALRAFEAATRHSGPRILESGLAIDAAIAGQGIALADDFLVADDLAHGRLVTLCDFALADCGYYLLTPGGTRPRRPLAAFRQWLLAETESLRSAA